ncbi:hypothetical protein BON30_45845 [Cystobacter ferrugineus]|uniref:Uncharacterized protein n=1 Tax=Cystobacter ferrugineus TaxID=83449 RepID=A0A1L9AVE4_9BACT|nr:hypothetical protein BON30_45845 [Cystobacter ferrugineus]
MALETDNLPGADTNGNGVRDDLDAYIDAKPDTVAQKKALRQLSAALSGTLIVDATRETALREAASRLSDGINCVWRNYDAATAMKRVEEMEKVGMNTRARVDAYDRYNTARSGSVMSLPEGDTCIK